MCLNRSSRKIVSYLHDGLRLEKENIFKQTSCLKSFLLLGLKHAEVGELGQGQFILSRDGLGQVVDVRLGVDVQVGVVKDVIWVRLTTGVVTADDS